MKYSEALLRGFAIEALVMRQTQPNNYKMGLVMLALRTQLPEAEMERRIEAIANGTYDYAGEKA